MKPHRLRFRFSRGPAWARCWQFLAIWGPGAGYIGGWTFYVAYRCKNIHRRRNYHVIPLAVGLTRNWNHIPWKWGW